MLFVLFYLWPSWESDRLELTCNRSRLISFPDSISLFLFATMSINSVFISVTCSGGAKGTYFKKGMKPCTMFRNSCFSIKSRSTGELLRTRSNEPPNDVAVIMSYLGFRENYVSLDEEDVPIQCFLTGVLCLQVLFPPSAPPHESCYRWTLLRPVHNLSLTARGRWYMISRTHVKEVSSVVIISSRSCSPNCNAVGSTINHQIATV